ncbi:hypothetical protein TgHK011_000571 [Trichoderma gracile]|nr:hypothetical protein TgHK011_000571 [Trichoderma gracile]
MLVHAVLVCTAFRGATPAAGDMQKGYGSSPFVVPRIGGSWRAPSPQLLAFAPATRRDSTSLSFACVVSLRLVAALGH